MTYPLVSELADAGIPDIPEHRHAHGERTLVLNRLAQSMDVSPVMGHRRLMSSYRLLDPPIGVRLISDMLRRGSRIRARVRWTGPTSPERRSRSVTVESDGDAQELFDLMRSRAGCSTDPLITLGSYADQLEYRYLRGVDMTSTASGYRAGLRLRVLPTLGHLQVRRITTGAIDRSIDRWEAEHSSSTLKSTIAALTRVPDEAVRDDVITRNPARDRANRRTRPSGTRINRAPIPSAPHVELVAEACRAVDQSYADHVTLSAYLVGDVDWECDVVTIERQCFPGAGGLITKPTKSRRARRVPIIEPIEPIEPTLRRLTADRPCNAPLLRGPRGGVVTTATLRDATHWDAMVAELGLPGLRRHGLRHAGATWFAESGAPLHLISKILGHGSIETTRAYLHVDDAALRRAAEQMNTYLRSR